ncbi:uncharacterized protein LOC107472490 [Arachis duranensis]|uniref:Uncharacterized protein LOC107472411 n=1 Tax=Arachis duranensis TaxID=130453 RepID=A0A6P4C0B2_ARADU|nr:uncharacterized protein LOC107472411 [Arachis duranensis]XP_015947500.1 uncharacterized protein LOC107472490 [Arachis duranensis]
MSNNSEYLVVCVYPNCRMRNSDNRVIFECENSLLLHTRCISLLSELKSLILTNLDGIGRREIGRVEYRLLASLGSGVFRFRLFRLQGDEQVRLMFDIHGRIMAEQVMELSAEVGDVGGGGFVHSTFVQDYPPLAPPPIHVSSSVKDMEDWRWGRKTSTKMHDKSLFSNTGEEYYNLDGWVEIRADHRFKCRDAVMQGVKNYSIRRSAEYRVVKSDRLKYHVYCRQAANGCPWSLHVALRQNLEYW